MLVIIAMLTALEVVLSRFLSIPIGNILKFGFNFVPICVAAYLYGPVASVMVGAVGDLLGALLFPTDTIFYGFTITAALT
ncbi:MAG: folate family ECF transporter S component, partial [Clostridia bacterium]|nr:folate family ECF transporter S component [Clostridia bacterium]